MTDQERAALIAWLEGKIAYYQDKQDEASENGDADVANYFLGAGNAYHAVKAHIESEATHDEA